ncbi:MAG TPA: hypothetical protein PKD55_01280 [Bellilinea sp.]|nr:hypothetical protein [Bellilinea sp.]
MERLVNDLSNLTIEQALIIFGILFVTYWVSAVLIEHKANPY